MKNEKSTVAKTDKKIVDDYIDLINKNKITLKQLYKKDPILFIRYKSIFKSADETKREFADVPSSQIAFLISGNQARIGKSLFSKCLSNALANSTYTIASSKVPFERYSDEDGIVWNDIRSGKVRKDISTDDFLNLVDPNKVDGAFNIKNSFVVLKNRFWFLNTIQTAKDFIERICSYKKEDDDEWVINEEPASQLYGRLNLIELKYNKEIEQIEIVLSECDENATTYIPKFSIFIDHKIKSNVKKDIELWKKYRVVANWLKQFWNNDELIWEFEKMNCSVDEVMSKNNSIKFEEIYNPQSMKS